MSFRAAPVYASIVGLTALVALASALGGAWLEDAQYVLLAAGTVLIGVPHGATDNHVFARLNRPAHGWRFYAVYLAAAALYGLLWFLAPGASLVLFLALSIYHFGQSNLFYVELPERSGLKKLAYLPWGAFSLAPPILFRYDQAAPVIRAILGYDPIPVEAAQAAAPWVTVALLAVNIVVLALLTHRGRLAVADLARELAGFAALLALYVTAPLYVSFIVYWAFWHAFNSAIEIARTISARDALMRMIDFFRAAWPLSLVTFAGMALIFTVAGALGSRDTLIGLFFIVIAAVTLPHMVVMELLYARRAGDLQGEASDRLYSVR